MPPVSKVMPLPTSATRLRSPPPCGRVGQLDQPRRGLRALPDGEDAAVPAGLQRLLVEHLDAQPGLPARPRRPRRRTPAGAARSGGVFTQSRVSRTAPATTTAARLDLGLGRRVGRVRHVRPAALGHRLAPGRLRLGLVAGEPVRRRAARPRRPRAARPAASASSGSGRASATVRAAGQRPDRRAGGPAQRLRRRGGAGRLRRRARPRRPAAR